MTLNLTEFQTKYSVFNIPNHKLKIPDFLFCVLPTPLSRRSPIQIIFLWLGRSRTTPRLSFLTSNYFESNSSFRCLTGLIFVWFVPIVFFFEKYYLKHNRTSISLLIPNYIDINTLNAWFYNKLWVLWKSIWFSWFWFLGWLSTPAVVQMNLRMISE